MSFDIFLNLDLELIEFHTGMLLADVVVFASLTSLDIFFCLCAEVKLS